MRASYSFALRDQNRVIYASDEEFVSSLPESLRKPTTDYLAGFGLSLAEQIAVFHTLRLRWQNDPLIGNQIAPSKLHWLSELALESAARMVEETNAPMHMHLLETPYQKEYAYRRTGRLALEYLDRFWPDRIAINHRSWCLDDIRRSGVGG